MSDEFVDLGCLPNGANLSRKPNDAGGYTYYSDEIGGGVVVWDTCLVSESTLLTAISCEHHRKHLENMVDTEAVSETYRSFVSQELMREIEVRAKEKDEQ